MINRIKEKLLNASGSVTGALSFLGGYQVCHNICLALISLLTIFGITVTGMHLLFLTNVAVPFWIAAFIILAITLFLKYKKKMHLSEKMIMFNSGLIIAGIPFKQVQPFAYIFWIAGGMLALFSIVWYFHDKIKK